MDLTALDVGAPEAFVEGLAPGFKTAGSVQAACDGLASGLYRACVSGPSQERSLVLSRVYLSLPFASLDSGGQEFARGKFGLSPAPGDRFLALMGTQGDDAAWNDRATSSGHRAIPLNRQTVTTVPMLARCFQQIGFDLDIVIGTGGGIHLEGVSRAFGLFHVENAPGSPFIPAQDDFVRPRGVRSVVGCGTMLPDGAVSVWIGFSRHPIRQQAALPLIPMMPGFWHAVQPLYRRRAIFAG
ncbi:MAG: hypothetical protein HYY18_03045 [Planctomycetes bacterium]|nr:hypothetical protein [Planctomycetota bacterium]